MAPSQSLCAAVALLAFTACGAADPPVGEPEGAWGSAAEPARGSDQGCASAEDCAPDHNCVPRECVRRRRAVLDQVCEESGPPIGACECVAGACAEVDFNAPDGRNARRTPLPG